MSCYPEIPKWGILPSSVLLHSEVCSENENGTAFALTEAKARNLKSQCNTSLLSVTLRELAKSLHYSIWKLQGTLKSRFPHLRAEQNLIITARIITTTYEAPAQSPTHALHKVWFNICLALQGWYYYPCLSDVGLGL